jgi:deoxyribonuclease-4
MIRFGTAGNGQAFYAAGHSSSLDMPKFLAGVGLNAYEYQCGRGVNVKEEFCRKLAGAAAEHGIALSIHAPYFINLATPDPRVQESSLNHIRKSLAAAQAMGAKRIVVHPGSVGKGTRREAVARALDLLERVLEELIPDYPGIMLCLETMGKLNQLGTLEEIIELCQLADCLMPTVDFGHLHARGLGAVKGRDEFEEILDRIDAGLGAHVVKNLHIHFSPIEYGKGGEIRHRTFAEEDYGPHFEPLAGIIARDRLTPVVISESAGAQVEDALTMQELYRRYLGREGEDRDEV